MATKLIQPQPSEPPRVLIVGYGDLGHAIGRQLKHEGLSPFGLRRSEHSPLDGIQLLRGDVTRPESLTGLSDIDPQVLLYCVAATEQSDENYCAHYVDGLRHVLAALAGASNLRHVFFVSSTRVYGQTADTLLTESDSAMPADFGGKRLLEAEQLLDLLPCGHSVLRLSGIYGPGRNRMLRLAATRAQWPQQNNWSNRIHRDDAADFIVFLIQRILHGLPVENCYIVTDSYPAPQHAVLRWLAARMSHETGDRLSAAPSGGKRLSNARMLASGFQFRYPNYQAGYAALLPQAAQ